MPFSFRLTFGSKLPKAFNVEAESVPVDLGHDKITKLVARDATKLADATRFHIEADGFQSSDEARRAAEELRLRLRVLNAVLGLGYLIPTTDTASGRPGDAAKQAVKEHDVVLMDSVDGVSVYPGDGRHFELVAFGRADNTPDDPLYILDALREISRLPIELDQASEDALNILGVAQRETSERAAFLITYLALDPLIQLQERSTAAIELLGALTSKVRETLQGPEGESLIGAIESLRYEGFTAALMRFARRIQPSPMIEDQPLMDFLSACVKARNRIAHNAKTDPRFDLVSLARGLRRFVVQIIWTRNKIPDLTVQVPPSRISIPEGGFSIRVL